MNSLTADTFNEFLKELFTGVQYSRKRSVWIGIDFAKSLHAEYGDEKFYAWLNMFEIQCEEEAYDYIHDFVLKMNNNTKKKDEQKTCKSRIHYQR